MSTACDLRLPSLRLEQSGRVLTARVDAPPFNYLTPQVYMDFISLIDAVETDRTVGAVIVTGALPGRFMTHFDIGSLSAESEAATTRPRALTEAMFRGVRALSGVGGEQLLARTGAAGFLATTKVHDIMLSLLHSPAVWIGAVNGPCGGGGLEMSLFFDLRVAADPDAGFLLPHLSVGHTAGVGAQRLSQLIGPARALEMMLEARVYSAREAMAMGLVNRVVPAHALLDTVNDMATRYAARPREAVAEQKRIVNRALSVSTRKSFTQEAVAHLLSVPSRTSRAALRRWLYVQEGTDGDSLFLTGPQPWAEGTAIDMNPVTRSSVRPPGRWARLGRRYRSRHSQSPR